MCGITGFYSAGTQNREALIELSSRMATTLLHRGPDDAGVWVDERSGVGLGFRRLSIIDLSAEGRQPMHSADRRYTIIFNGEIYNFLELRAELIRLGHGFRGHSDTEVLLAGIAEWGVEPAIQRSNGMFAFALWDSYEHQLYLGRDRIGKKPLYYGRFAGTLLFGSELKALRAHPAFRDEVDRGALTLFLRFGYVPAPYSIYAGVSKVLPGTIVRFARGDDAPQMITYWTARDAVRQPTTEFSEERVAVDQLDTLLRDAVKLRMVSDVPLGAFLSGGIDSSTIVALMQSQSSRPVQTFTIGFREAGYDEAEHARAVAQHLGTDHTELYVTPTQALEVIPQLPRIFDEPFADSSQIPTYLVSCLARSKVTVSLSGDGGDELFGGYNRHLWGLRVWNLRCGLPSPIARAAASLMLGFSPAAMNSGFHRLRGLLPRRLRIPTAGDKISKFGVVFSAESPERFYEVLVSNWKHPEKVVRNGTEPATVLREPQRWSESSDFTQAMMYLDLISYLPDDILVKVDRATMSVSLEGRAPLLDYRVVEFAWRLPISMKIRGGQGKYLLRQVLDRYVPRELTERPKMGFGVPIDSWLRGPLRNWAEALLDPVRIEREGFFHASPIQAKWNQHLSGERNWQYELWNVLMFQAWLEAQARETSQLAAAQNCIPLSAAV
jgi:asparagine synthase (glutamine-hydrolysing)